MKKRTPRARTTTFRFLLASLLASGGSAYALSLGEIDVSSFLGQPLDFRIAVESEAGDELDASCFVLSLYRPGSIKPAVPAAARFTLEEMLSRKSLRIRTYSPVRQSPVRVQVSAACKGNTPVVKVYSLQLEPMGLSLPTSTAVAPHARPPILQDSGEQTHAGIDWHVREGDTVANISQGLYPHSSKLQSAFAQAIHEANPRLPADSSQSLPLNETIRLPDLKTFANQSAGAVIPVELSAPAEKAASVRLHPAESRVHSEPTVTKTPPALASKPKSVIADVPEKTVVKQPTAGERREFRLKLSGAEVDISRSRGITEAMRTSLREKQLILDSDDQVAALLSLMNTVKQLESRLNDLQLKLSKQALAMSAPVPAPVPAPAPERKVVASAPFVTPTTREDVKANVAAGVTPTSVPAAQSSTIPFAAPPAVPKLAAPETPLVPAKTAAAPPVEKTEIKNVVSDVTPSTDNLQSKPAQPSSASAPWAAEEPWWAQTWVWLMAVASLLVCAILLWLRWRDTRNTKQRVISAPDTNPNAFTDWAKPPGGNRDFESTDIDLPYVPQSDISGARQTPNENAAVPVLSAMIGTTDIHADVPSAQRNQQIDETPASLELDTRPTTRVDFPLMDDDGEDRQRRQRYMDERYAEFASKTITIDDPDSIIDAARQYFEEGHVQKALELLTYAFEERPGQLRFWLAVIEIYRLERMTAEFCALAAKFRDMHSGTDIWPKIQHIGRDLDPSNPLFAAALGRLGLPDDREFDPVTENWLNAPMDFTSDVLMVELRSSLLDEHGVEPADLRGTSMARA